MSIIFAGGELSSFTKFNAIEVTTAGAFAPPARCGIHVRRGGFIKADLRSVRSDIWLHCDLSMSLINSSLPVISVLDAAGVNLFSLSSDASVKIRNVQMGRAPIFTPGRFTLDIHLKSGTAGLVEIYADSQLIMSVSGSYSIAEMSTVLLQTTGADAADGTNTIWSQVIIADESTIGFSLATLALGAGAESQWSGGVADINEIALDESTYISAATTGLVSTWAGPTNMPTTVNIRAVVISCLAKYATIGPKNIDAVIRLTGANYYTPMTVLGLGYTPAQAIMHVNPTTNAAWAPTAINDAQFGVRSKL